MVKFELASKKIVLDLRTKRLEVCWDQVFVIQTIIFVIFSAVTIKHC